MQVKTILNRIQKHRGFVYGDVRLEDQLDGLVFRSVAVAVAWGRDRLATCGSPI